MHHLSPKASRRLINIATVVCGLIIILLVIYWYRLGILLIRQKCEHIWQINELLDQLFSY